MSDSIWKKDLSFKRTPKADGDTAADAAVPTEQVAAEPEAQPEGPALPPTSEKQSFLKKEISFGRKPKAPTEAPTEQPEGPALPPTSEKQSFLKKEISFGRKKKTESEVDRLVHEATQSLSPSFAPEQPASAETLPTALAESAVAAMEEAAVVAEAQAVADAQAQAEAQALADAQAQAQADELAYAEAVAQAEAVAHAEAEAAPGVDPIPFVPVAEASFEPMFVEHAPVEAEAEAEAEAFEPAEPVGLAAVPDPEPVDRHFVAPFHDEPSEPVVAEHEPTESLPVDKPSFDAVAPEHDPLATVAEAYAVSELAVDSPAEDVTPEPVAFEPAAAEPVAAEYVAPVAAEYVAPVAAEYVEPVAVEPVAVEPEAWAPTPEPEAAALESPEPWLAAPELPPAPDTAVVVHPPVAAADLPPLADAPAKDGPFWKKELSFSRKPKQPKEPKAPKVPKAERAPKTKSASTPFWKKQIGRKPAAAAAEAAIVADAPVEAAVVAAAPKVPFWKKQVSLGRKKVPAEVAVAAATAELPAGKPVPFWKKLPFSMPALALPTRSSGGGKKGGHAVKKLVGLKIGSSQLAAARVSNNGVAEVQQLAREVLAPGIVVGGELRDPDALGEALKGFFSRNKLPKKGVRLGIASNRIGVRIFDIVGVTEDKQLANAIHFRAQETLPIPLDEAVLDYRVLGESVDAEGQPVKRVLLVVVYRELVERYVAACKKAGIQLAGIDLEAFALLRTLAPPVDRGSSALVGVAIGYDRSTFAVSDGRICEFTRVLEWGGSALNVALARTFDSTPSEVEAIKRSLSLDESTVPPGLTTEQAAQAVDAVRRQVQSFARELVSSLQFYQNQPGSLGIGEIVLTGGTTHLPGLAAELERLIGVHVRVGDPFSRVKISKRLEGTEQSGSLAVAIGLGIED